MADRSHGDTTPIVANALEAMLVRPLRMLKLLTPDR
jgi:hypothetical protein